MKPPSNKTILKNDKEKIISALYEKGYLPEEKLFHLLVKTKIYKKAENFFIHFKNKRPNLLRNYDQFFATTETSAKRLALLNFLGDLKEKKILFLGDDDFVSLLFAQTKLAYEVVVVDIDQRILNLIDQTAKDFNLLIKTFNYDLKNQ